MILILASGASYTVAVVDVARLWNPGDMALLIVCAAQVTLLVSAPVYWHTRADPVTVRMEGWAPFAVRPPAWLLPWGLLTGAAMPLALLEQRRLGRDRGVPPGRIRRVHRPGQGIPAALADR